MVRYREILRLSAMGVSVRSIAESCRCSTSTVTNVQRRARASGVSWPLPEEVNDQVLREILYPPAERNPGNRAEPDCERIRRELGRRGVTLTLLWNEYCDAAIAEGKEPLMYSQFCQRYRAWKAQNDLSMHIERRPAQEMQVDWVGDTMQVVDPDTGEILPVFVFVACLPYSNYLFAEGFFRMDEESWIAAHVHAFAFFGGTTPILVPDNLKTAVTRNIREELILNDGYRRMAEYYGCAVIPARPRRPRDKGSVEMGVGVIERQAMAALRDWRFMTLSSLNRALLAKVEEINARPFQKRPGSRTSVYSDQERALLIPLPAHPYEPITRKIATVGYNYHASFKGNWYSVPFLLAKREVEIAATASAVSIICDGQRVAIHKRLPDGKGLYSTNPEHMPDAHRDYVEWNGERFRKWAASIGPGCAAVIAAMLSSKPIEQQAYRSCRAVLALAKKHGEALLEEACAKAIAVTPRPAYKTVKSFITALSEDRAQDPDEHAYLRGGEYYRSLDERR